MADYVKGTTNIWPYYSADNKSSAKAGQENSLGKDEFLKILVAQIKNQDPMKPLEDKEFIAQMAQFTSVEQLMNMSTELKELKNSIGFTATLIGKSIEWETTSVNGSEGIIKSGTVDSISMISGESFAVVDGEEILISRILAVKNESSAVSNEVIS
ncbi:MAG: flagellar hook capping FlgD N-terminal domain-containing protein [Paenibacillaceae bacterium]